MPIKHSFPIDGQSVTVAQFAALKGVTPNTVYCFLRNHNGSLDGFDARLPSRVKPRLIPCAELGCVKTIAQWATHFGVSRQCVKHYANTHSRTLDGFASRKTRASPPLFTLYGNTLTLAQWAHRLGLPYGNLYHLAKARNFDQTAIEEYLKRRSKEKAA